MWKNLERLLYNAFFITSRLISASQPGFKPGDPCISYQLPMAYIRRLMRDLKFEMCFLTY